MSILGPFTFILVSNPLNLWKKKTHVCSVIIDNKEVEVAEVKSIRIRFSMGGLKEKSLVERSKHLMLVRKFTNDNSCLDIYPGIRNFYMGVRCF